ncbi:hypothetical protein CYFUS_003145 [Cystobacter fuscus]|uniref:Uncharacterized protein n=1 Tax=Cystobacter fuscus TaxID=43 RepID=A0A250J2G1_9BACT|nr:hypothetical protein [Cystobacter fuscus]ATB37720.1 hypothetical protein CYFUS_003145 [Cystobacter fuscus]
MTGKDIRTKVLRQYYEASYGVQVSDEEAFKGATFDEYYQLKRIQFPAITRRRAAEKSERPEFQKLAAEMPPDPPDKNPVLPHFCMIERKPELDLASAKIGEDVQNLTLSRIKSITAWKGLRRLERLERFSLSLCGSASEAPLVPPVLAVLVNLGSCAPECVEMVLRSTDAQKIRILHEEPSALSLSLLRGHARLEELVIDASLLHGLGVLKSLPLKRLYLSGVAPGQEVRGILEERSKLLAELGLVCDEPFGPSVLPDLPSLERLKVPGYEQFRSEWIDWAVANPKVACEFIPVPEQSKRPTVQLAEVYRDVDILRVAKGKQQLFEVAANLVEDILDTDDIDNGELEDRVKALAKKAGKKAQWSSESDTFVMQAKDLDTCRWLIDSVYELRG